MDIDFEQALNDTLYNSFDSGYYIGMMSGTSLDGMDAVICQFDDTVENTELDAVSSTQNTKHRAKIIATHSVDFPPYLRQVLMALCQPNTVNHIDINSLNLTEHHLGGTDNAPATYPQSELEWFGWASREYGEFASQVIHELLEKSGIDASSILAVGCHGQTVRHRPHLGFTLQLVDANIIAERTGISVVSDFRRRDMAVGGQGAPLAPAFHLAQFTTRSIDNHETAQAHRIIVNLGGIANITALPSGQPDKVIGYDTGPANLLLDGWYQHHYQTHIQGTAHDKSEPLYDKSGVWAQSGEVNIELLDQLLTHDYFNQPTPKSTGREDFNFGWLNEQIAIINTEIPAADVQATLTAFTAKTLADAINQEAVNLDMSGGEVIVCGGGAYNDYLLSHIADLLPHWQILTSSEYGVAPTWVEAMAFAWLAQQTIMGETGNLPAVTGANKAVVLGQVCFA